MSPERDALWEPTLFEVRKATSRRMAAFALRSHRGLRAGHACSGVPQEPGRPCHLGPEIRGGGAGDLHPAMPGCAWPGIGANNQALSGNPRAKETKVSEMDARESERSIIPWKRGNLSQGTPGRDGRAVSWNSWRERWREYRVPQPSQRNCKRWQNWPERLRGW